MRSLFVRLFALFACLAALLSSVEARAEQWTPPPLDGHVVDSAGVLSPAEVSRLDRKLDHARRATGFAIVVLTMSHLPEGMSIEDVGYTAGNAWKVGSKEGDDGVILVATISDRHLRIETGKGVGGALTDIQSSEINRKVIGPLMKQGQYYQAFDRGTDAILKELVENTEGGASAPGKEPAANARQADPVRTGVTIVIAILVIIGAIVSPTFRHMLFLMLLFGRGGGGRGGGGGGGGSGYGGGGGSFGGGGSSDDY